MLFASLPDPSGPGFPAIVSILCGFVGTSVGLSLKLPRDAVQWIGFLSAYFGVGFGLMIYLVVGLARGL